MLSMGGRRENSAQRWAGITRSDLLVINKTDLAPYVGADLAVIEADTKRMRGSRPYVMASIRHGKGLCPKLRPSLGRSVT